MSSILASVSVFVGAELSEFKAKMAEARRELRGLVKFSEGLKDIGSSLTQYVTVPLLALGGASVAASAKIDSLRRGLEAITVQELGKQGITGLQALQQAASLTTDRMKELQVIARQPGLGFEGAVQGDVRLRAVGISAEQSAKSIKAFANAVATTGGGKSEFDRVTVQLAQLSAKGKVLAQDLRPIIEAAPAVSGALQKLYGTVDSETISASLKKQGQSSTDFIAVLTEELSKLPQVTGGLKAMWENGLDALTLSAAKFGDGVAKAFNLQEVGQQLTDAITGLGDRFASLSPGVQKAIVVLGSLVAATGPVAVALGTLGAATPAVIAGIGYLRASGAALQGAFAALLTPTGAVVAVLATLAAVVYAAATANERAYASFHEQTAATRQLTTEISPLLDRYDELKSKTALSVAEHDELKAIIEKVTGVLPDAGKGMDQYGHAIELVTDKARTLIAQNQELDKKIALQSLPAQLKKLDELQQAYAYLARVRDEISKKGTYNGLALEDLPVDVLLEFRKSVSSTTEALEAQKKRVAELRATISGLGEAYEEVNGLNSVGLAGAAAQEQGLLAALRERLKLVKEQRENETSLQAIAADNKVIKSLEAQIAALEGIDKQSKKAQDALQKLAAELRGNGALSVALGADYDFLKERQKILESGLKSLVQAGVSPASAAFRQYAAQLKEVNQVLGDNDALSQRFYKNADLRKDAPQRELANPFSDTSQLDKAGGRNPYERPGRLLPLPGYDTSALGESAQKARTAFGLLSDAQKFAFQKTLDFNVNMEAAIAQLSTSIAPLLADFAGQFGDAFGSIVAGTATAGEAMTQLFSGILGTLSGFMADFGKQLIAIGIGKLSLDTLFNGPQGGPLAIAAGLGLVALAGVTKAIASSASSSLSKVTSVGSGGASGNFGQSTPQKIQVEVVGTLRGAGKDLVAVLSAQDYRRLRTS
ncbi:tape measure protein [Hymenobacter negativus]|uniref:Tape measure protein n=1 Tax=Hymenobacter negativus TaxID=2795026 RepID=A0ABS0Q8H9_9BACT|nr:tape measure protein [Hymenobacter negativus]MBH8558997.1 tape measure protein [Hymenobacter negativus]